MASPGYRTFGSLGGPDVQTSGPLSTAGGERRITAGGEDG